MRNAGAVNLAPGGVPIRLTTPDENARLLARQMKCYPWIDGNRVAARRRGFYITLMALRWYRKVTEAGGRVGDSGDSIAACLHRQAHTPVWARP